MRPNLAILALTLCSLVLPSQAGIMVLQAPEGDTVMGVVKAALIPLRDTIGKVGEAAATAREGESFPLLLAQDGWYKVDHPSGVLWTPQNGIRVTTAKTLRAELAGLESRPPGTALLLDRLPARMRFARLRLRHAGGGCARRCRFYSSTDCLRDMRLRSFSSR